MKFLNTAAVLPFVVLLCAITAVFASHDRVHTIPSGQKGDFTLPVRSYAGHINVNNTTNANLFYWFFEASEAKKDTPLLIWINGGPGASSMMGLFKELGPLTLDSNLVVKTNKDTWCRHMHCIFWDQPVGTGFSYVNDGGYMDTEEQLSVQFTDAMEGFLALHPEYKKQRVVFMGESYGGKYVPYISTEIMKRQKAGKDTVNLTHMAVGDGWYDPPTQIMAEIDMATSIGLIDTIQREEALRQYDYCISLIKHGKFFEAFQPCTDIEEYIIKCADDVNVYDVRLFQDWDFSMLDRYFAREDVRLALHTSGIDWQNADGTGPVNDHLQHDVFRTNTHLFPALFDHFEVLLYAGNLDLSCNNLGLETIMWHLQWHSTAEWRQTSRKIVQTADGSPLFVKKLDKLTMITLPNAGHLVPHDRPAASNQMVQTWVFGKEF